MKYGIDSVLWQACGKQAVIFALCAVAVASCSSDNFRIRELVDTPASPAPIGIASDDIDIERFNAESDFSVAKQIENEYLVLTAVVTESEIEVVGSRLTRGPEKANSAFANLKIVAFSRGKDVMRYTAENPRLTKVEGRDWVISDSAQMVMFVPLRATVDSVEVRPVRGQQYTIEETVKLDPRPWAISACRKEGRSFAACPAIEALAPIEGRLDGAEPVD